MITFQTVGKKVGEDQELQKILNHYFKSEGMDGNLPRKPLRNLSLQLTIQFFSVDKGQSAIQHSSDSFLTVWTSILLLTFSKASEQEGAVKKSGHSTKAFRVAVETKYPDLHRILVHSFATWLQVGTRPATDFLQFKASVKWKKI